MLLPPLSIPDPAGALESIARFSIGLFGSALNQGSTSIFSPAATPAHSIFSLSMLVIGITGGIFFVVGGLLAYVLVRYRHRPGQTTREPAQIYGSNQIELSWTVIPVLIILVLFLATTRVVWTAERAPSPGHAMQVIVIGHQYWWEFRYPKLGIVTANELHVPVSTPDRPMPTYLTMSSADTDHSFWVPRLAGKTDVLPNKVNIMWIDPDKPGLYLGQCSQYCGVQHAKMLIRVYADTPRDFAAWAASQQRHPNQIPMPQGERVFLRNACINCHTMAGTPASGRFGPDLTHVASRATIASGSIPNTPENLRAFVENPSRFKPGVLMPTMNLSSQDLDAVTSYLNTLR